LDAEQAAALPPYPGRALHALFYQWLAAGDPALATRMHAEDGPRPFTVGLVYRARQAAALRCTLLDDALWPVLARGIAGSDEDESLVGHPLTLPEGGPQVRRQRTYAALLADASTETRFHLRFRTPTCFRTRGMDYPLPDPLLVFQSWLNHWNTFAPPPQRINVALLDLVAAHVAVGRYGGHTEMVKFGDRQRMVGFVGTVRYVVVRHWKLEEAWLRKLNALADYAPYCGTGCRTTQGMGQTEGRVK
jgi:CRISPR-associated endoribonuclease Cas6